MANDWRLLKTIDDTEEAIAYIGADHKPIEILMWNEHKKQAHVTKIDGVRPYHTLYTVLNELALAWRPSEDEEKFEKFLAKLDEDYDAYVLEFSEYATPEQQHVMAETIRDSLESELPFKGADYFVFEIAGSRLIVLIDNIMSFDIPTKCMIRIQKTTPSYAAHDHGAFAKCLKEQRRQLSTRFFGANVNV